MNDIKIIHDLKSFKNLILMRFKKDKIILMVSFVFGLIVMLGYCKIYSDNIQNDISEKVLRFHVLAQSNNENDQLLKMKVKEKILQKLEPELKNASSKEELLKKVSLNLENIELWGKETLLEEGCDLEVKAELCKDYFPTKNYANVSLPNGSYDALRVTIGEGKGRNWWCVLYPPLCFVDISEKNMDEENRQKLKKCLSEDEYDMVTTEPDKINFKFKIVEIFSD